MVRNDWEAAKHIPAATPQEESKGASEIWFDMQACFSWQTKRGRSPLWIDVEKDQRHSLGTYFALAVSLVVHFHVIFVPGTLPELRA